MMVETNLPVLFLRDVVLLPYNELRIELSTEIEKRILEVSEKQHDNHILFVNLLDSLEERPNIRKLPKIAILGRIKTKLELPNGTVRLVVMGIDRVEVLNYCENNDNIYESFVIPTKEYDYDELEANALKRILIKDLNNYIEISSCISNNVLGRISGINSISRLSDIVVNELPIDYVSKVKYVEICNPMNRIKNIIEDLNKEMETVKLENSIDERLKVRLDDDQKNYILKEKIRLIKEEINEEKNNSKTKKITVGTFLILVIAIVILFIIIRVILLNTKAKENNSSANITNNEYINTDITNSQYSNTENQIENNTVENNIKNETSEAITETEKNNTNNSTEDKKTSTNNADKNTQTQTPKPNTNNSTKPNTNNSNSKPTTPTAPSQTQQTTTQYCIGGEKKQCTDGFTCAGGHLETCTGGKLQTCTGGYSYNCAGGRACPHGYYSNHTYTENGFPVSCIVGTTCEHGQTYSHTIAMECIHGYTTAHTYKEECIHGNAQTHTYLTECNHGYQNAHSKAG